MIGIFTRFERRMSSLSEDSDADASAKKKEDSNDVDISDDDYDDKEEEDDYLPDHERYTHDACYPLYHCRGPGCPIWVIARNDDVESFLERLIKKIVLPGQKRSWTFPTMFLEIFIFRHSVKCITQVVHHVDFNSPHFRSGLPPLHLAVEHFSLPLVELFLQHNAPTNFRSQNSHRQHYEMLPFNYSLHILSRYLINFDILTPEQSVYKMLIILCLPELRTRLQIVGLLAQKTDELGEEIYYYAKNGRLVELAILLLVAREKVMAVSLFKKPISTQSENDLSGLDESITLRDFVISQLAQLYALEVKLKVFNASDELLSRCREKQNLMRSTLLLLEIFRRAGEAINSCLDQRKTQEEVVKEVSDALKQADFSLDDKDMDVSHVKRFLWPIHSALIQLKLDKKNAERSYQLGTSLSFGIYANWRKDSIFPLPRFNAMQCMKTDSRLDEVLEESLHFPLASKEKEERLSSEELVITLLRDLRNISHNLSSGVLETIISHLDKNEQIGELICYYVTNGSLVKAAAMLFFGWEKLMTLDSSDSISGSSFGIEKIRQFVISKIEDLIANGMKRLGNNEADEFTKTPICEECLSTDLKNLLTAFHLLEAFDRAGDDLDHFIGAGHSDIREEDLKDVERFLLNPKGITLTLLQAVNSKGPGVKHSFDHFTTVKVGQEESIPYIKQLYDLINGPERLKATDHACLVVFLHRYRILEKLPFIIPKRNNGMLKPSRFVHVKRHFHTSSISRGNRGQKAPFPVGRKWACIALSLGRVIKRI